jgi:hypothetical protein
MDKEEKEAMIAGARSLLERLKEAEGQYADAGTG